MEGVDCGIRLVCSVVIYQKFAIIKIMNDNEKNYEDFISTVSHELRTPLTSIRGFSQTMLNSWDKLDDTSKKRFLKIIEEQSNRLINLVENMLSVTRLSSEKDTIILKQIQIKPAVETVLSVLKTQYPEKNFLLEINKKTPPILADADKFQQIMTNIIENASKYSLPNSDITIRTGFCDNCEFVSIKVTNQGIAILKDDYEKIFTKFARIGNPLTRKVQGSGLGLYITKNLIERMNGKISVISKGTSHEVSQEVAQEVSAESAETTFEILLPVGNLEKQARVACNQ